MRGGVVWEEQHEKQQHETSDNEKRITPKE
jgi:hypothetical protein